MKEPGSERPGFEYREYNPQLAILELREPIEKILDQLQEKIKEGKYEFIIGDDRSGRIPALIFDKVLKRIYEENGHPLPQTLFFAGGHYNAELGRKKKEDDITKQLQHYLRDRKNSRERSPSALVVTETMSSGDAIKILIDTLKKNGFTFDIASIGIAGELKGSPAELEKKFGTKIYHGMNHTPMIYHEAWLTGVRKEEGDTFSQPMRAPGYGSPEIDKQVRGVREDDIPIMADRLMKYWDSKIEK